MKKSVLSLAFLASLFSVHAMAADAGCSLPGQVTYCGEVGTSKEYDFDSLRLLEAVSANKDAIAAISQKGHFSRIKVEVLPSRDPANFSSREQYTFEVSNAHPFMPQAYWKTYRLVLTGDWNKQIQDATIWGWQASDIVEVPYAP